MEPATYAEVLEWRDAVSHDPRMRVDYGTSSMIFRLKPTGIAREFTGVVIYVDGRASIGWLEGQIRNVDAPADIASRFANETATLVGAVPPVRWIDTWGDGTGTTDSVPVAQVLIHRDAFTARMRQVINELEAALRS